MVAEQQVSVTIEVLPNSGFWFKRNKSSMSVSVSVSTWPFQVKLIFRIVTDSNTTHHADHSVACFHCSLIPQSQIKLA